MVAQELYTLMRKDVKRHIAAIVETENEEYLSHREAAALLGMSPSGLYQRTDIPFSKPGKRRLYAKSTIIKYIRGG